MAKSAKPRFQAIATAALAIVIASVAIKAHSAGSNGCSLQSANIDRTKLIGHRVRTYGNPAALVRAANFIRHSRDETSALLETCVAVASRLGRPIAQARSPEDAIRLESATPPFIRDFVHETDSRHWTGDAGQLLILASFRPTDDVPPPSKKTDQAHPCSLMVPISRTWPILFICGVPFDMTGAEKWAVPQQERGRFYGNSLVERSFFEFVSWADDHAALITQSIVPPDDIFESVDAWAARFAESDSARNLLGDEGIAEVLSLVRGQVIRMMEGVLDRFVADETLHPFRLSVTDLFDLSPAWPAYRDEARSRRVRWNRSTQAYEIGG